MSDQPEKQVEQVLTISPDAQDSSAPNQGGEEKKFTILEFIREQRREIAESVRGPNASRDIGNSLGETVGNKAKHTSTKG
jgi:hypothetical protein